MMGFFAQEASTGEAKDCLFDIKRIVQNRYKVILEESWKHERPEVREPDRRWYEQIPCLCGGFIGLYAENPQVILQFYSPTARKKATAAYERFKHLPGVRLDDRHDGWEIVFYFPAEILIEVAEMVGARRKRQGRPLTEEQKATLAERGRKALLDYRLKKGKDNVPERQEIHSETQVG